jgi:hypothetical protein
VLFITEVYHETNKLANHPDLTSNLVICYNSSYMVQETSTEELLQFLSEENFARYEAGEIVVYPGQNPEKPVLRDAKTKVLVKGTGITPNHNDSAEIGRLHGYKQTNEYQAFLEGHMDPAKIDAKDPNSLEWWWKAAQYAASPQPHEVTCPCGCGHTFMAPVGKPDGNLIFRMMERVFGKAMQRQEIDIKQTEIMQILNEGVPVDMITIHTRTPEDIENRRKTIEAEFEDV